METKPAEVKVCKINREGILPSGEPYIDFRIQENTVNGRQFSPLWIDCFAMGEMTKLVAKDKHLIIRGELKGNNYKSPQGININRVKLFVAEMTDGDTLAKFENKKPTKEEQEALPFD